MTAERPLRVLVVDDSATVRVALRELLGRAPSIGEVESAPDGRVALAKVERFEPDVVTMDVAMPGMDGLATLRRIMAHWPRPVIMLSAHTFEGAANTMRALEWGAVDFVQKPGGAGAPDLGAVGAELIEKIVAVGLAHRRGLFRWKREARAAAPRLRAAASAAAAQMTHSLVAIGASTGGTEAIRWLLGSLPWSFPAAIVIVQHMPAGFTRAFADRLNEICPMEVKEAGPYDLLQPGRALIAPGHSHLLVRRDGPQLRAELSGRPPENGHRPSVDVLFRSVAALAGLRRMGVILTGMGRDGATGLRAMRETGARTVAQDEHSCVVFGMPKVAVDEGAVDRTTELRQLPALLQAWAAPATGREDEGAALAPRDRLPSSAACAPEED